MRLIFKALAAGLVALALAGCAGTPPAGAQQASNGHHAKCEITVGSMLCGNAGDQPLGNPYAPNSYTPGSNRTLSEVRLAKP